jgi:hypothetical protein
MQKNGHYASLKAMFILMLVKSILPIYLGLHVSKIVVRVMLADIHRFVRMLEKETEVAC